MATTHSTNDYKKENKGIATIIYSDISTTTEHVCVKIFK